MGGACETCRDHESCKIEGHQVEGRKGAATSFENIAKQGLVEGPTSSEDILKAIGMTLLWAPSSALDGQGTKYRAHGHQIVCQHPFALNCLSYFPCICKNLQLCSACCDVLYGISISSFHLLPRFDLTGSSLPNPIRLSFSRIIRQYGYRANHIFRFKQ